MNWPRFAHIFSPSKSSVVLSGVDLSAEIEKNIFESLINLVYKVENSVKNSDFSRDFFGDKFEELKKQIDKFAELGLDEKEKEIVLAHLERFCSISYHCAGKRVKGIPLSMSDVESLHAISQGVDDKLKKFKDMPIAA